MQKPDWFVTVHRPKQHSAGTIPPFINLIKPKPTEIELVRALKYRGIRITDYEYYNNRGNEKFMVINWRRKLEVKHEPNRGRNRKKVSR
jgi:hypothetical protein